MYSPSATAGSCSAGGFYVGDGTSCVARRTRALRDRLPHVMDSFIIKRPHDFHGGIGGIVVHDDELELRVGLGQNTLHGAAKELSPVLRGKNNAHQRSRGREVHLPGSNGIKNGKKNFGIKNQPPLSCLRVAERSVRRRGERRELAEHLKLCLYRSRRDNPIAAQRLKRLL